MRPFGTGVSNRNKPIPREFALDVQVPLLHVQLFEIRPVGKARDFPVERCILVGRVGMRISTRKVGPGIGRTRGRIDIDDPRERLVNGELPLNIRPGRIEINAVTGAEHGLLVGGEGIGEADSRREQILHCGASGARYTGIAIEEHSRRRVDIDGGLGTGTVLHSGVVDGK